MIRTGVRSGTVACAAILALALAPAASAQDVAPAPQFPEIPSRPVEPLSPADAPTDAPTAMPAGAPAPLAGTPDEPSDAAAGLPVGFVDELVVGDWDRATGVTFAADGRAFVWEKSGRVWMVVNGVKSGHVFLDIREEVGDWEDFGLISFALDPNYLSNGFVYAAYVVDHHYLTKFGTAQYDPAQNEYYVDTIARITRFRASAGTGFQTVVPGSRKVLLGESITTGLAITGFTHGPGSMEFGADGTLVVSFGDGVNGASSGTALGEGIIKVKENVGPFRAQLLDCLGGKVLRLDPATGDGVPSNPFYDPAAPRSARSRVFDLGLRNPFRMTLRPGSGNPDPSVADPGTVYLGDVGAESYEELDVARTGGVNFGWPIYEALHDSVEGDPPVANLDAANPLFGTAGCQRPTFLFQDLLIEDTLNTPSWPNPCNPSVPIVTTVPLFMHQRPVLEWRHGFGTRVPVFDAGGVAQTISIDDPASPVSGAAFGGSCSVGGCWYTGTSFPATYQGTYFHGDFGGGWMRNLVFDGNDSLLQVRSFAEPVGRIVSIGMQPVDGSLWYINYTDTGISQLRRLRYVTDNVPPQAVIKTSKPYGPAPLTVTLDATSSVDPEGQPLSVTWDFGDGTPPSHLPIVTHIFPSEDITASGNFTGEVFDLVPPGSMGFSNHDPEVMRDGDLPPLDCVDKQREFDTIHKDAQGNSDKGPIDTIGYTFNTPWRLRGVLFQEGMTFPGGGFFDSVELQAKFGNVWAAIPAAVFQPTYPGELTPHYETFEISFPPMLCRGIRLAGPDGGLSLVKFITVGEFRVIAAPAQTPTTPQVYTVTLTVQDPTGGSSQATRAITINDTPPLPTIVRPDEFMTFDPAVPSLLSVGGVPSDPEQHPDQLQCNWQVIHHHDEHTHPGPVVPGCLQELGLSAEGCDGGVHWLELRYTVTDPIGLSATASRHLVPVCDRDLDGVSDALEIALGQAVDSNFDGIPDKAQVDCDGDGRPDLYETFFGYSADSNANGIPDDCERAQSK